MDKGHAPIIYAILSHMSPWDRTQNAPLVCKRWAEVARTLPPLDPARKRMAWLVWKHLLEERGIFHHLIKKALPAPALLRGYIGRVQEAFDVIACGKMGTLDPYMEIFEEAMPGLMSHREQRNYTNLFQWSRDMHSRMVSATNTVGIERLNGVSAKQAECVLSTFRTFFSLVDDTFWGEFCSLPRTRFTLTADPPCFRPLYECYQRLAQALEQNFGITNIQYGFAVKKELDEGPERERLRQEKRIKK